MKYALFLGCFIPVRLPHLELIARRVLPELGLELVDLEDFSCCPEPVGFLCDKMTQLTIAARNICLAEEAGLDIITLCNGCTYTLKQTNEILKKNLDIRTKVNAILKETGYEYRGSINVNHYAHVISQNYLDLVKGKIKKKLNGLKVACHTGCHILSPSEVMDFGDPLDSNILEELVRVLGAEPVDWDKRNLCCGWTLMNYGDRESANKLIEAKHEAMRNAKADCSVVICPQCFHQFDTGQLIASRMLKSSGKIPVFYYLQLLALAMGYSLDDLNLEQHKIRDPLLEDRLRGEI